jgi:uncharacterized repeat protein (TIGR03803 family)
VRTKSSTIREEKTMKIVGQKFSSLAIEVTNWLTVASALSIVLLPLLFAAPAAYAQTYSVIHAFTGIDGAEPSSGVTIRGNALYGTVPDSCTPNCMVGPGFVYQITHAGSNWTTTPLFSFTPDGSKGYVPTSRVQFGPDGHLYGTTTYGGGPQNGGVVFTLTPPVTVCITSNCLKENVLHVFTGPPDGREPYQSGLLWDSMGNIFGTTQIGGTSDKGTVFEMTKSGNDWTETPIHSFDGSDGQFPSDIMLDSNGNLFGMLTQGGLHGFGSVFELKYQNGVGWTETNIYDFQEAADGGFPSAGLVQDAAGNLYGSTSDGGSGGGGTLFELSPMGNSWAYTLLHSFSGDRGCGPGATLTMDAAGSLYGTTYCAGANKQGNIFKLANTPNGWVYTSLHDFTKGADGGWSTSIVSIDTDRTLYGTTRYGGNLQGACGSNGGCGVVWMIKP